MLEGFKEINLYFRRWLRIEWTNGIDQTPQNFIY